jgi:predicted Fe-Mo cluster-binding NifX family protein
MKVAIVSRNGKSVTQHFGRAPYYVVVTVEDGEIVSRETRAKAGHDQFEAGDSTPDDRHDAMAGPITDCDAVIVGGMGQGAVRRLQAAGVTPILTDETDIDRAALRYARGDLPNLVERIHSRRGEHQG